MNTILLTNSADFILDQIEVHCSSHMAALTLMVHEGGCLLLPKGWVTHTGPPLKINAWQGYLCLSPVNDGYMTGRPLPPNALAFNVDGAVVDDCFFIIPPDALAESGLVPNRKVTVMLHRDTRIMLVRPPTRKELETRDKKLADIKAYTRVSLADIKQLLQKIMDVLQKNATS